MVVWVVAVALALRCYVESVMTAYYVWPALAVGVLVGARRRAWRFALAVTAALFTTVAAQWQLAMYPWWIIDIGGITTVLIAAAGPALPANNQRSSLSSGPDRRGAGPDRGDVVTPDVSRR